MKFRPLTDDPRANRLADVCVIAIVVSFDKTKIRTASSMLPIHPARHTERCLHIEINNFIRLAKRAIRAIPDALIDEWCEKLILIYTFMYVLSYYACTIRTFTYDVDSSSISYCYPLRIIISPLHNISANDYMRLIRICAWNHRQLTH